jgi:hypothetical protein
MRELEGRLLQLTEEFEGELNHQGADSVLLQFEGKLNQQGADRVLL